MTETLSIALAQFNPTVGNLRGNIEAIHAARAEAAAAGADLVVFGELAVAGYPPEDLVLKPAFQRRVKEEIEKLAAVTKDGGPAILLGVPWRWRARLYNAALLLADGEVAEMRFKHELPNYGVFDEVRLFASGTLPKPIEFKGVKLGVMVCEDMWKPAVAKSLQKGGAAMLIVINGSPFEAEKDDLRLSLAQLRIRETGLPLIYLNLVGGQDELVFDGDSFVLGADGELRVQAARWRGETLLTRWRRGATGAWDCDAGPRQAESGSLEDIWMAMTLGLKDYVAKNGFGGVLIGLSGGIDSAISAAVAVDALGADRVHCVMMPSPYTSQESLDDAAETAKLLGIRLDSIRIEPAMQAFGAMLQPVFLGMAADTTEENIQARSRGITLMALSNKLGYMVLSTGNKSEMSVGYATLYGDMCGGYSVLKDIYKTTVFALTNWRNQNRPEGLLGPAGRVIPERVITKPPTAELKPNQTDQDTLPPYEQLDAILKCLIEGEMSLRDIAGLGHDPEVVGRVWRMLDRAEYKRRQAPPGVKITGRAFGRDRRYPITNGFASEV
jgi:NAD+ synthase